MNPFKNISKPIVTILLLCIQYSCSTQTSNKKLDANLDYLPTSTTGVIIHHKTFSLSYSEEHEQAEWVAYALNKNQIISSRIKRPYFIQDEKVLSGSAHWKNYKKSGYTRGHLLPAGDRRFNKESFEETFLTSNISPQLADFNAGIWNRLEQKTRYWAQKYDEIYVITGGVLSSNLKTIGFEKVSVPKYFFKIILDYTDPEIKAIAFLIPHKESEVPLYKYVTSIDKIESLTNIDFFSSLPDKLENELESSSNYKNWSFK